MEDPKPGREPGGGVEANGAGRWSLGLSSLSPVPHSRPREVRSLRVL